MSSQQSTEGGGGVQIALQKTGLRAEISHNAADKKVGHITFGGHVTGMQTADGVVRRKGVGDMCVCVGGGGCCYCCSGCRT